jgi:signal transduction histidine kinase
MPTRQSGRAVGSDRRPARATAPARPGPAVAVAPPAAGGGLHHAIPGINDRFFRQLIFNLRNGVMAITRDGRVAAMNDIAYRVLGLPPQPDDIGRPFAEVLSDCPEVARVLQSSFDGDDLPNRAEMRLRKTGRAIGYTLSHVNDEQGHKIGATLFFKDLTRVEQLEERERLRDRLATLGEMAAAIAHEVKNPLASIEIAAGVLKRQLADHEEALETLDDIIKEAKMANAIVVEVLEFVRPISLQVERVSADEVFKDSITMAESKQARGAVTINLQVADDVPDLLADPHQLRQLFTNLLANAFEALGGEGHVDIRATVVPGEEEPSGEGDPLPPQVVVDVRDNGPGIGPDDLERVFSPFFTTKPQGTGLGLAIVRKVVHAHDGSINAVSAVGRGTTFRVRLPVVPSVRTLRETK